MEEEKFTADEITKLYTGNVGYWQVRTLFIAAMVKIPAAWQMASILFTAMEPKDTRCILPDELRDKWRNFNHTRETSDDDTLDTCFIYGLNYSMKSQRVAILPVFNNLPRKRCIRLHFDSALSLTSQFETLCERKILVDMTQFFYLLGLLVGAIFAPVKIERFGPRHILLISMIIQIIFSVMSAYSPLLEIKFIFRFIVAYSCSHLFAASFKICTDIVHSTARSIFYCCYEIFWSFGIISLPVLSYFFPGWIQFQIALSSPLYIILMCFRLIPDSPQWLLRQGMYSDAKELLETAAKLNERRAPDLDLEKCLYIRNEEPCTWMDFVKVCTCPQFVSLHLCWGFTYLTYYGYFVNLKTMGNHLKIVTIAAGLCEVVGISLGLFLEIGHNRKKWIILGAGMILVGASTTMSWIGSWAEISARTRKSLIAALGLTARVVTAVSFTLLIVASIDIFEERFRIIARTSCTLFAKTILLCSPFLKATTVYGNRISLTIYGAILVMNGLSTLVFSFVQT